MNHRPTIRCGLVAALVLLVVFGIASCTKVEEPVVTETKLCGKFTFPVASRTEASKARVAFYAANVRFRGLDFADDHLRNSSRFILGGQTFVLEGLRYQDIDGDPPLALEIRAYSTVRNTPSRQSVPCTSPGSVTAFDSMKAAISETWNIQVELESPEYDRQRTATK